jgi:GT2 family glycosyltransferase
MERCIAIVIVNWNSGPLLAHCIRSIGAYHSGLVEHVVVIDNASADESLAMLPGAGDVPVPLRVVRNDVNTGFAAACNQGAALTNSKYLLFLNPDAELMNDSLRAALEYLESPDHRDVGVVGIQLEGEDGNVARSCARLPAPARLLAYSLGINRLRPFRSWATRMEEWPHDCTRIVDQVIGAFFFTRRSVFDLLAGFDERFFVYYEEVDYSARMKAHGYHSVYLAGVRARHVGGGSSRNIKAKRLFYSLQSCLLYACKHFKPVGRWVTIAGLLGLEPVARLIFALLARSRSDFANTLSAYKMLYGALPQILARAGKP